MAKEEDIIKTAIDVFATKGMQATVADIAEKGNFIESSIYRIFRSRDGILLHIYERFWDRFIKEIQSVIDSEWEENAIEKIKRLMILSQSFFNQDRNMIRVISSTFLPLPEMIQDDSLKEKRIEIRKKNREAMRLIDEIIRKGQEKGAIIKDLKAQVIRQIFIGAFQALIYGLFMQFDSEADSDVAYTSTDVTEGVNYILKVFSIEDK